MTAVPIGRGAYKRLYAGTPEVKLLNRWLEANPANLREGTSVLARPGTTPELTFPVAGDFTPEAGFGPMRGQYSLSGLFSDSLFVVCGDTLYRIHEDMTITTITGIIHGTGYPETAWQKGADYERLWISDGQLLQYYDGTSKANGTLTLSGGSVVNGTDKFEVGGVYYTWGTVFSGSDSGSVSNPFIVNPTTITTANDPMGQLVLAITDSGTPGVDYSGTISGANTLVSATVDAVPGVVVTMRAVLSGTSGNSITTTVTGGTHLAFSASTLLNGGIEALQGCTVPDGQAPISITQVSSYVLVAVANSQRFYWVNPGDITIDGLSFASKESSPDNIVSMRAVGDQVLIMGTRSTENWYATGVSLAPFAPIEGRVYARGIIPGTPVVIDDGVGLVGDDGRVYLIGYQPGDSTDTAWGANRISNNGIEERIRRQIRREGGLKP